jgi:hypothetical protein
MRLAQLCRKQVKPFFAAGLGLIFCLGIANAASSPGYVVFPFNNLGMHCLDNAFSRFSLLPPFNVLHAQVIQIGPVPVLLHSGNVSVRFRAMADPTGSFNSYSAGKSDFWQYALSLFGVTLPQDDGLEGCSMPGALNLWRSLPYEGKKNWFAANGIPVIPVDDAGNFNPFPVMAVTAFDKTNGSALATAPVTLPVSWEAQCNVCHETGSDGASPGFHGVAQWSTASDLNLRTRDNILTLHDALSGTNLVKQEPVLCNKCHYSPALDLAGTGPVGTQINPATNQPFSYTSRAIHRHHGSTQLNGVPIGDEGVNTCYYCHPGPQTKCLRGAMSTAGMICQNCHGGLQAVAGANRQPWIDTPKCQSCHTGNALDHLGSDLILKTAYTGGVNVAIPNTSRSLQFAENPDPANPGKLLLYRESMGHAGASAVPKVACSACHGSPHSEWPVTNPQANDNLTPIAIQGYAATITECYVCHGTGWLPPAGKELMGPHGIHIVNDQNWCGMSPTDHKVYLLNNPYSISQCQGCHGVKLEGTAYSRVKADRMFMTGPMMNNMLTIPKGTAISCNQCHVAPER